MFKFYPPLQIRARRPEGCEASASAPNRQEASAPNPCDA